MLDPPRELLAILDPRLVDCALPRLRAAVDVIQVLPPRLALVRADRVTAARINRIEGVLGIHADTVPELPADLTPAERLFVYAWEARRRPRTRTGEGLSWDAPGFSAPDSRVKGR